MKTLTYWRDVQLVPGVKWALIPEPKITSEHPYFEDILNQVVKRKISYALVETQETKIENRDCS
jgi:hypothetical protein